MNFIYVVENRQVIRVGYGIYLFSAFLIPHIVYIILASISRLLQDGRALWVSSELGFEVPSLRPEDFVRGYQSSVVFMGE